MSYLDRSNEVTVHGGQFTNVTGNSRKVAREGDETTETTGKRAFPDSARIRGWLHQLVEREPLPRSADSGHQDPRLGGGRLASATSEQVQVACINCRRLEIPCITTDNPPENPCAHCAKDRLTCTYVTPNEFELRRFDSPHSSSSLPQYSFAQSRAPTYSFPPEYLSTSPLRVSHTLDHIPDQSSSPPPVASSSQTTSSPQPIHRHPSAHEDIQTGSISVLNGASGQNVAETFNEAPVSTFVVYMPEKPSRADDPTAVRPEDVQFLESNVAAGGSATSIYRSIEAENWVEQNYDTVLLKSIRSAGLGGPMATMMSTDMPALAIFGSTIDNRVLELGKTLSEVSMFAVMVRSATDDPLVKFNEERRKMDSEAGSHRTSMAGDDDETDEESILGESDGTDTESDDNSYRDEAGVLRLRGGALHQHGNRDTDPDYITPAGIARPDGSHRTKVKLHLQLRENCRFDVTISSKSAFKFQTEKGEPPHELTDPITRPQVLSCIDLKVEARPIEVELDRSYSNLGFVVNSPNSIAGREYLPRGFDPPSVKATHSHQKTKQNVASLTVGLASIHPTLAATGSHGRTDAETLQLADEKAAPTCHVKEQVGKEWDSIDKSYSSYDVAWHPVTQTSGSPHPVNIRFGMGIEFYGREERNINKLPSISHILRNQIILWVFDPELQAKVRGVVVLTTTYIADIKITEPLIIVEDEVVDLAVQGSHNPPATVTTALTSHAANSVAIGLFDERKDAAKRNVRTFIHKIAALSNRKGKKSNSIDLYEYVARGWDATNEQWRNVVWPTLDQNLTSTSGSLAAWTLALSTANPILQNHSAVLEESDFDASALYDQIAEELEASNDVLHPGSNIGRARELLPIFPVGGYSDTESGVSSSTSNPNGVPIALPNAESDGSIPGSLTDSRKGFWVKPRWNLINRRSNAPGNNFNP